MVMVRSVTAGLKNMLNNTSVKTNLVISHDTSSRRSPNSFAVLRSEDKWRTQLFAQWTSITFHFQTAFRCIFNRRLTETLSIFKYVSVTTPPKNERVIIKNFRQNILSAPFYPKMECLVHQDVFLPLRSRLKLKNEKHHHYWGRRIIEKCIAD